jgi:hypothetical protein
VDSCQDETAAGGCDVDQALDAVGDFLRAAVREKPLCVHPAPEGDTAAVSVPKVLMAMAALAIRMM